MMLTRVRSTRWVLRGLCAAAATLLLSVGAVAQETSTEGDLGDEWPFGAAVKTARFQGLDLFNLGLIGAKCGDAAVPRKEPGPVASGRRQMKVEKEAHDDGPETLRVDIVLPDGPAAKAGLRSGDVIVGAGGKSFKKGTLPVIAKALLKAEAGGSKGILTLSVERPGEKGKIKVPIAIPQGGKIAAKPTEGAGRERMIAFSLKWLADRQGSDGGYEETLSGRNGAVIQTALAGLCWLGGGSDLERGEYQENVQKAFEYVSANLTAMGGRAPQSAGGPSWDQSNWGYAHAAIFLGELHHRNPTEAVRQPLFECAEQLCKTQEDSGGWAHGPGGENALGYLELNIVTGLALTGIGLAQQAGFEVPDEVLSKVGEYLKQSSDGGGVAYSAANRGGGNIGRSAGCWLGYVALGLGKSEAGKKMASYVKRTAGNVLGGHASLMQHILLAGVAAEAQGGEARKNYWETALRDMVLARSPDGSFQPRPWHESKNSSNSDVTFGEVWTTAAWTCVLVAPPSKDGERPGLPAWTGKLVDPKKKR